MALSPITEAYQELKAARAAYDRSPNADRERARDDAEGRLNSLIEAMIVPDVRRPVVSRGHTPVRGTPDG